MKTLELDLTAHRQGDLDVGQPRLEAGRALTITVTEIASSGYLWSVEEAPPALAAPLMSPRKPALRKPVYGATREAVFHFEATEDVAGDLRLRLSRSFAGPQDDDASIVIRFS